MTASLSFIPTQARSFDLVNTNLQFTTEEMTPLERNGFFVSDLCWLLGISVLEKWADDDHHCELFLPVR